MRLTALVLVMACMSACTSPLAPSRECYTQPRKYSNPVTGEVWWEVDHYQAQACPAVPIE